MTENKRYYRTNVNLEENNHEPYYNIRDRKKEENNVLFMVGGKYTSKEIVDLLNALHEDNQRLIRKNKRLHRDWDKLYDLCLDKGCTEDEIIKEMER